jgi:hypothetical protein
MIRLSFPLILLILSICISGCRNLGANSIKFNRPSYIEALSQTDKEEMLANIVRAKYNEPPVFLTIKTITASPSMDFGVEGNKSFPGALSVTPGLSYETNPTVFYTPLLGKEYSSELLMPLGLVPVFLMLNNGFDLEIVANLMILSVNDISNSRHAPEAQRELFQKVFRTINQLTRQQLIHIATTQQSNFFEDPTLILDVSEAALETEEFDFLAKTLKIDKKAGAVDIKIGLYTSGNHIVVNTRSILAVINYLSNFVSVPEQHKNWVWKTELEEEVPLIDIKYSVSRPANANTQVFMKNHWFYVEQDDIMSQNTLYLLRILFDMQAHISGNGENLQLTLPVR